MLLWVPAQRCHIKKKKRGGQGETDEQEKEIKELCAITIGRHILCTQKNVLCYVAVGYEKKKEQVRTVEFSRKPLKEI